MNIAHRLNCNQLLEVLSLSKNATAIYTTYDLIIETANDAMIAFWGKDRSIIGKPLEEAVPELKGQPFKLLLQEVLRTGVTNTGDAIPAEAMVNGRLKTAYYNYEYRAIKDGAGKPYCVLHTATDVTERVLNLREIQAGKLREQTLNEDLAASNEELAVSNEELTLINEELREAQENYLQAHDDLARSQDELLFAIDAAGLGTWSMDLSTKKFSGNVLFKAWLGLQPHDEIDPVKTKAVISDADRTRILASIDNALNYDSGGNYDIVYTITNPLTQAARIVRAKGKALFNEQHKPIRFSGTLQDITEQKQDEIRKNDFIGMVSHELKTPLTSIKGFVQLLALKAERSEDDFTSGALAKVDNQVNKMTQMINGFLNVSRLESGKIFLNLQQFDLMALIKEAIESTEMLYSNHHIRFYPCAPLLLTADMDKIDHVLSNLLSNAIKYSADDTTIEVTCMLEDNMARISVKDEGIGIAPNDLKKLFERYYRVEDAQHISGFGIGLYLSAEIVESHKGKIWAESVPGKGSTFHFTLPI